MPSGEGYGGGGLNKGETFSITMLTELRDGTTQAVTVRVEPGRLPAAAGAQSADTDAADAYQDELYDRAADAFGRLIDLWLKPTADKDTP